MIIGVPYIIIHVLHYGEIIFQNIYTIIYIEKMFRHSSIGYDLQEYESVRERNTELQELCQEQEKALAELGSHLSE